jgi:hypothetical protein
MQCENCGKVFLPGQQSDMIGEGVCTNCGRPYRHQPGGENVMPNEMAARGMPAPGEQDMTGNPLMEGIWGSIDGGWQNRMKRDESYASVRRAQNPHNPVGWRETGGGGAWQYPHDNFQGPTPVIHWDAITHQPQTTANDGGRPVIVDVNSPQLMRDKTVIHVGQPGWTHSDMMTMGNTPPNRFQFSNESLPGVMYDDGTAKLYPGVHPDQDHWEQVMHQALGTQPVAAGPDDSDLWDLD